MLIFLDILVIINCCVIAFSINTAIKEVKYIKKLKEENNELKRRLGKIVKEEEEKAEKELKNFQFYANN